MFLYLFFVFFFNLISSVFPFIYFIYSFTSSLFLTCSISFVCFFRLLRSFCLYPNLFPFLNYDDLVFSFFSIYIYIVYSITFSFPKFYLICFLVCFHLYLYMCSHSFFQIILFSPFSGLYFVYPCNFSLS